MDIEAYRRRIDELDREIVRLINERATCARAIGERKERSEIATFAPGRERQVFERVAAANPGPLSTRAVQAIYGEIISACRALERDLTISYWGPPASNTHVAARQRFGSQPSYLNVPSVADVFSTVEKGHADFGVVPVENSTQGVVTWTLDMFLESELRICSEIFVQISHNLLSNCASLADVSRIYTMPQATAQCRSWLAQHLPGVELVDVSTTARAAQLAAAEAGTAAIANGAAAEEYGVRILAERIEDNPRNRTRFAVIGRIDTVPTGRDKTSILFSVPHEPGSLIRALSAFSDNGVNLTMIESRPTRQQAWEYIFFVDVLGHVGSEDPQAPIVTALEQFKQRCSFVRVLGSYPEAE